jgi:hypothetical protein
MEKNKKNSYVIFYLIIMILIILFISMYFQNKIMDIEAFVRYVRHPDEALKVFSITKLVDNGRYWFVYRNVYIWYVPYRYLVMYYETNQNDNRRYGSPQGFTLG